MSSQVITFCSGKGTKSNPKRLSCWKAPKDFVERIDQAVEENFFKSRSEFIRFAIHFYIDYLDGKLGVHLA